MVEVGSWNTTPTRHKILCNFCMGSSMELVTILLWSICMTHFSVGRISCVINLYEFLHGISHHPSLVNLYDIFFSWQLLLLVSHPQNPMTKKSTNESHNFEGLAGRRPRQSYFHFSISTILTNSAMNPTTFPYHLHHMLQAVKQGDSPPVTWLPHGRAFIVTDQQRFLKDVIPVYFSQTKMRSFTRQLNLWGFKR